MRLDRLASQDLESRSDKDDVHAGSLRDGWSSSPIIRAAAGQFCYGSH